MKDVERFRRPFQLDAVEAELRLHEVAMRAEALCEDDRDVAIRDERGVVSTNLEYGLRYYWLLMMRGGQNLADGLARMCRIVRRGAVLPRKALGSEAFTGVDDMFLACLLVLLKHEDLRQEGASLLRQCQCFDERDSECRAVAGLIRGTLLGDACAALQQGEFFLAIREHRMRRMPAKQLISAFLARDTKMFERKMQQGVEQHWKIVLKRSVNPFVERNGQLYLKPRFIPLSFFWPWPEAVFALLLMRETDWRPSFKSEWLPEKILDPEFGRS